MIIKFINRFEGVKTEEELEKKATSLYQYGEFIAGLVFTNVEESVETSRRRKRETSHRMSKHVEYKIRMDIDNVESTLKLQEL